MNPTNPTPPASEQAESTLLSRGDFMRSLGLNSAALMAFYCMGTTLTSCKGSDPAPVVTPPTGGNTGLTGNTTTAGGAIDFTMDLTNATYSSLKAEGGFAKVGDVFVFNAKGGKYVAVQRLCPHANQDGLGYRLASDDIQCSVHGSEFKTDGTVTKGPAATALRRYTPTLVGDKLQVKA